jgi:hypothetical protein
MTPVVIKPGVVFWPLGAVGDKTHPWVVLSCSVAGCVLAANLSDYIHDPSAECVLKPADHSCLRKPSFVYFAKAVEMPSKNMGHVLAEGKLVVHHADLTPAILSKVMAAAKSTRHISDRIKIKYGIIPPPQETGAPF